MLFIRTEYHIITLYLLLNTYFVHSQSPYGFLSNCPGVTKNVTITKSSLKKLHIIIHKYKTPTNVYRRRLIYEGAVDAIATDKNIDLKNKKSVMFITGYIDSQNFIHSRALANVYSKLGYNVFLYDILYFTTIIYPKAVRISRAMGRYAGEFLSQLSQKYGVKPEMIEVVGLSMGAHIGSYAAKLYYERTGRKINRLTGLDPAGPCFRSLDESERFSPDDAIKTDAIHTNIDTFGISEPIAQVDFYVNGGEWQPSDIPEIPCLVICSHLKSIIYWISALSNPGKFVATRCENVDEARSFECLRRRDSLNSMGLGTNFSRKGVYFLPTDYRFPYYSGKNGLKRRNEVFVKFLTDINNDDILIV